MCVACYNAGSTCKMSPEAVAAVACSVWLDFANWVNLAFRLSRSPILGCAAKASSQSVTCACKRRHE